MTQLTKKAQEILARKRAAKEDLALIKKHGSIAITDTVKGCITVQYENGKYQAHNHEGLELIGPFMDDAKMLLWLSQQYQYEAA